MQDLKMKLLNLKLFVDNEYLNKYVELITKNEFTNKIKFETNTHHIIPRCYFKNLNLEIDNSHQNTVNLLYRDHIYAHFLLTKCTIGWLQNLCTKSLLFMTKDKLDDNICKLLDEIQIEYIKYKKWCSERFSSTNNPHYGVHTNYGGSMLGKHHSDETKQKISALFKNKKHSIEFIEKRVCKHRKIIQNVETGEIYNSCSEAGKPCLNTYHTTKGYHYITIESVDKALDVDSRNKLLLMYEQQRNEAMLNSFKRRSITVTGRKSSIETKQKLKDIAKIKLDNSINTLLAEHNIDIDEYINIRNEYINNCPNKEVQYRYNLTYSEVRKINKYYNLAKGGSASGNSNRFNTSR